MIKKKEEEKTKSENVTIVKKEKRKKRTKNHSTLKEGRQKRKDDELINPISYCQNLLGKGQIIPVIVFEIFDRGFVKYESDSDTLSKKPFTGKIS